MTYIDDWGPTPSEVRKALERPCGEPSCAHPQVRHGVARKQDNENGWKGPVVLVPGPCDLCRCKTFWDGTPITSDDILDAHKAMEGDVTLEMLFR